MWLGGRGKELYYWMDWPFHILARWGIRLDAGVSAACSHAEHFDHKMLCCFLQVCETVSRRAVAISPLRLRLPKLTLRHCTADSGDS
jgi:hypothetical protein